ncbi:uncharacterized protein [Haliotis asinina]|uniref:uncharacterized protein n=1 Tax=Haliotis asinina TaxID=109174 RepID=UPI00353216F1
MNFVYFTTLIILLSGVLSVPRPSDNTSYRCYEGLYAIKYTHTYIGCVSFCWYSTRCKAVTWDRTSRDCRLHDSTLTHSSTSIADPRCISADIHSSDKGPSHPCRRRPCPDTHVCAPAEAASSHVCLPLDALAVTSTTTPVTTTIDVTTSSTASTTMTSTTTSVTTPDTSCYVYMGCYKDDGDRMINDVHDRNSAMTHEWCLARCRQGNYILAGLEHYDECLCGNSYDNVKYTVKNEAQCNTPCDGNSSQMCGGPYRLSLYQCI